MTPTHHPIEASTTRALRYLAAAGPPGHAAAVRLEALRSVGLHSARRRLRQEAQLAAQRREGHHMALYRRIWAEAAEAVGAKLKPLDEDFLRITRREASTVVRGKAVAIDDPHVLRLAAEKDRAYQLVSEIGLTVPRQLAFGAATPAPAACFLAASERACFVKPADHARGGSGATGGILEHGDLLRAVLKASRWSERLLIEQQAPGLVYRLLFLDGDLLDVVQRRPPELRGDGHSTVAELVALENDARLAERNPVGSLLRLDLDAVLTLRRSGLTSRSVPAAGRVFGVKSATSQNGRCQNETYRGPLSAELVDEARRAATAVGIRLAGVDVVTPDPSRPMAPAGGVIIEVNGEPGLQHHYEVAEREEATPVAVPILERLLEDSSRS